MTPAKTANFMPCCLHGDVDHETDDCPELAALHRKDARRATGKRFKTPEARNAYFDELAEAIAALDAIASKGSVLQHATEPAWLRPMGADQRIHNRTLTED